MLKVNSPEASQFVINPSDYSIVQLIGNGSFGSVYLVNSNEKKDKYFSMKIVKCNLLDNIQKQYLVREIEIMATFNHPALLELRGYSLPIEPDDTATILTDYMSHGSVSFYLDEERNGRSHPGWDLASKYKILFGVAVGMYFLHARKVLHRDLKPENILLDDQFEPKIGDFGLAKKIVTEHKNSNTGTIGTPLYMAPELFTGNDYDFKIDTYSFGMIAFEMLTATKPFQQVSNPIALGMKICNGDRPNIPSNIPVVMKNLIESCWNQNPASRPTFETIVQYCTTAEFYQTCCNMPEFISYQRKILELDQKPPEEANGGIKGNDLLSLQSKLLQQNKEITELRASFSTFMDAAAKSRTDLIEEIKILKKENSEIKNEFRDAFQRQSELLNALLLQNRQLSDDIRATREEKLYSSSNIPHPNNLNSLPLSFQRPLSSNVMSPSSFNSNQISSMHTSNENLQKNYLSLSSSPGSKQTSSQPHLQTKQRTDLFNGIFAKLTAAYKGSLVERKVVEITGSSYNDYEENKLKNIIDYNWEDSWSSTYTDSSYIQFRFLKQVVNMSAYAVKTSDVPKGMEHLKSWVVEGSNDGKTWVEIDSRKESAQLNNPSAVALFQCKGPTDFFNCFRIRQTGPSHKGASAGFALTNIEFFGQLRNA